MIHCTTPQQERIFKLETFICNMVSIPHVAHMICVKAFLGIMDQVRHPVCCADCGVATAISSRSC
jgi:hypothetical protein